MVCVSSEVTSHSRDSSHFWNKLSKESVTKPFHLNVKVVQLKVVYALNEVLNLSFDCVVRSTEFYVKVERQSNIPGQDFPGSFPGSRPNQRISLVWKLHVFARGSKWKTWKGFVSLEVKNHFRIFLPIKACKAHDQQAIKTR